MNEIILPHASTEHIGFMYGLPYDRITPELVDRNCKAAGIFPISPDGTSVLLGGHTVPYYHTGPWTQMTLWGNFAGHREDGESIQETALREAQEELFQFWVLQMPQLHPPTVIIQTDQYFASVRDFDVNRAKYGIVYPVVIDPQIPLPDVPSEAEIQLFRWFSLSEAMELSQNRPINWAERLYKCDFLWAPGYFGALLNLWDWAVQRVRRSENTVTAEKILTHMHTFTIASFTVDGDRSPFRLHRKSSRR